MRRMVGTCDCTGEAVVPHVTSFMHRVNCAVAVRSRFLQSYVSLMVCADFENGKCAHFL